MWYSGVACMIVVVVGVVVSLIRNWRAESYEIEPVDPDLLTAGVEKLFCCWPRPFKR